MKKLFKQYEVLKWASLFLEKYNRESGVAELLLQHHLGVGRSQFFAMMRDPVPDDCLRNFEVDLIRHATTGVPVQHLMGYEHFYGREFKVNDDVLIPRPETEELIERVLHYIDTHHQKGSPLTIVDVGTGSGIIAITLALERPYSKVYAIDISRPALQIAKHNAKKHQANVTFLQGNFLEPMLRQKIQVDLMVSNPPYIAKNEKDVLVDTVKNFDPELALFADEQGLSAYQVITRQLSQCLLQKQAALFYEIGYTQAREVETIIKSIFPDSYPVIIQDINQKDRMVFAEVNR